MRATLVTTLAAALAAAALAVPAASAAPAAAPALDGPCTPRDIGGTATSASGVTLMCVGRGGKLVWTRSGSGQGTVGQGQQGSQGQQGGSGQLAAGQPCRAADAGHLAQFADGSTLKCTKSNARYVWTRASAPKQGSGASDASSGNPNIKPVLTRLPVEIVAWDGSSAAAGSVQFTQAAKDNELHDDSGHGAIWPSGKTFATHPPEPSLTFRYLDPEATVVSSLEGTVVFVRQQPETCDTEINIVPKGAGTGSNVWVVTYDHVRQPLVKTGQAVVAGTPLGKPGPEKGGCGAPYRLELQVNRPASSLAVCPLSVFSPAAATAARAALTRLMTDWNTFIGSVQQSPADIASGGCLAAETKA